MLTNIQDTLSFQHTFPNMCRTQVQGLSGRTVTSWGFLVFTVKSPRSLGPTLQKLLGGAQFRHYLFSWELAWRSEIRDRQGLRGGGVKRGHRS